MLLKRGVRLGWVLLALALWLLGSDTPVLQHMPMLGLARLEAQGAIPAPTRLPASGDCSVDNIFYGAIPPGGENGRVLVFVHGYSGLARDWWTAASTAGVNDMYALAYKAGYRTAFVNTNTNLKKPPTPAKCLVTDRKTSYDMFNNGAVLSKQIAAISEHYGVSQLDVVAHSKGGTDAQTAIVWFGSWRTVRNLFTLGTPHQGSLLADLIWSPEGLEMRTFIGNLDRATLTMRTPIMQLYRLFTDLAKSDDAVQYHSGAGNFWAEPDSLYVITGAWLQTRPTGGDNDGVVTVASTLLSYAKPLFLEGWTHSRVALGRNAFPYIHAALVADITPPSGVALVGPKNGTLGRVYEFSAYVPITITRPVSYTWAAAGQNATQGQQDASSSKAKFVWTEPGTKQVSVSVTNGAATVVTTHEIQINPLTAPSGLVIRGATLGDEKTVYTFDAELPAATTAPVTYVWHATDQIGVEKAGDTLDSLTLSWKQPGRKVIEVVATNEAGSFTATHVIQIGSPTAIDDDTEAPPPPDTTGDTFKNKLYMAQVASGSQAAAQASSIDNLTDEERAELIASNLILRGGEVAGSATEQLPIESGVSGVTFMLLATDPSVQGEVVSPDGTAYALTSLPSEPGSPLAELYASVHTMKDAPAGNWQVRMSAAVPAGYLLVVSLDTPLQVYLQGVSQDVFAPGSTLALSVLADTEAGLPVVGQVDVSISSGLADEAQVGTASATAFGSTLDYVVPTNIGIYGLGVTVNGQVDGSDFERSFVESLTVLSDENEISIDLLKGLLEQWYCESSVCSDFP